LIYWTLKYHLVQGLIWTFSSTLLKLYKEYMFKVSLSRLMEIQANVIVQFITLV
jgi:hypothetical protein